MARFNVYVADDLHAALRAARVPVSEICQRALRAELERLRQETSARRSIVWAEQPPNRRQ